MILGIDASNIKTGGGMTHLFELISHAAPTSLGVKKVIIFGGKHIERLPHKSWLHVQMPGLLLRGGFINETLWKIYYFKQEATKQCDLIFAPAGTFISKKMPYVSMSQNMLIFEREERKRYKISWTRLRLKILNYIQKKSFNHAKGIIFISNHAKNIISPQLKNSKKLNSIIIHHGISPRFKPSDKVFLPLSTYQQDNKKSFKLLYVSTIDVYKHQLTVAAAVTRLVKKGIRLEIHFIGGAYPPSLKKLQQVINLHDPNSLFIKYHGKVPYESIETFYKQSDGFIFASTCENMPNIVIEAMASGLPILASHKAPMPEFLENAAMFFNPLSIEDTTSKLEEFLLDVDKRKINARRAVKLSKKYSWEKCAAQTFTFLMQTYLQCAESQE